MGIYGLSKLLTKIFPNAFHPIELATVVLPYEHIFMDTNCFMHGIMRERLFRNTLQFSKFSNRLHTLFDNLLQTFPANKSVYMCVDGTGPFSKIPLQYKTRIHVK